MYPTAGSARLTGLLYLLMGIPGPFVLIYLPGKMMVRGNAAATAANLVAFEKLFRFGIVIELLSAVIFVLLAMALSRLFENVDRRQARLMVAFVLASVAITFMNSLTNLAALALARGPEYLAVFNKPQREAMAMLFLGLHSQGNFVNQFFWGLWLLPFGLLVMKSGFIPRLLGVLLLVNGTAYVVLSAIALLAPASYALAFRAATPALMGELWMTLWLLIKGVRSQVVVAAAA